MLNNPRIILRQISVSDANQCAKWFCSSDVMKNCFGGKDLSIEEVINRIKRYHKHYENYGFSKMGIELISSKELIGDAGLMTTEIKDEIDIGYRLRKDQWGKGYASEAVIKLINYWKSNTLSKRLIALSRLDNEKSIRLLQKNGFKFQEIVEIHNQEMAKYYYFE